MADIQTIFCGLLEAPAKIKQYVIDPLKIQYSYLCCSNIILKNLSDEVQRLDDTRANLQQRVDAATRNLEIIRPFVKEWLKNADEIKKETDGIFRTIPEIQQGCVNGSCPNLKLRYSVSRKAKKMTNEVAVLVQRAGKFDSVADRANPPASILRAPGTEFDSRKKIEEKIMAALRDDKVYLIGIAGMGGVGKTTMAKKIKERVEKENPFSVAMAVVSQQPDRKKIQQEIAEALGLKLEQEIESNRAGLLHEWLMQEKSILIIIDDIWEKMNLEELGIPSQSKHKGCKIILTSRDRSVCEGIEAELRHVGIEIEATEMEKTKIFQLSCLDEEEAWSLFRAKAGTCVDDHGLNQIARDVAKECKGLPLALVTVGCALSNKKAKPTWEDALTQLKKSAPSNIPGVLKDVYQPLEWSYKNLESDEARYFFLLCCLWPEDSRIILEELFYYGVGLRIFSNVATLRKARNRVYMLVEMLESRNLLEDDDTEEGIKYVKMHDVIRDMAIALASRNKYMKSLDTPSEWQEELENYTCISLSIEDADELPRCINCPTLKMFRVNFKWYMGHNLSWQAPDTYFERMRELNVLDINYIRSLPAFLRSLTNLRTLRMRSGKMEDVSMIGQLVKLEILDLSYSKLQVLWKEIGGLEKLKSLDLRGCSHLREIAPGVISRLVRLEELFVWNNFKNWEAEVGGEERRNASLVEVTSLKRLTALQLHVPDPEVLPPHDWPELERFAICIGRELRGVVREKDFSDKNLLLQLNQTTPLVHAMIRKVDFLDLTLIKAFVDVGVSDEMGTSDELIKSIQERNEYLKSLKLNNCDNMEYLVNKLSEENNVFPKLRF